MPMHSPDWVNQCHARCREICHDWFGQRCPDLPRSLRSSHAALEHFQHPYSCVLVSRHKVHTKKVRKEKVLSHLATPPVSEAQWVSLRKDGAIATNWKSLRLLSMAENGPILH